MKYLEKEIKSGIKLHQINTGKFKTNLISVFLTTNLDKDTVTKNALLPMILRRGSKNMKSQEEISICMEEMYGASFDCGVEKTGDNQILKFYLESINDSFLGDSNENMIEKSIDKIFELVFNPYIENGCFKKEYVDQEKEILVHRIESKIDNKSKYAIERCFEEMYRDKPYGLYKFGYVDDIEKIDEVNLKAAYDEFINNCKIDIFVSGVIENDISELVMNNEIIKNLNERTAKYNVVNELGKEKVEEKVVNELRDVSQGKLIIGLDIDFEDQEQKYAGTIYNSILGGSANSKMFQNVREQAQLAYVASSSFIRQKNNIIISLGIEISDYEKALDLVKIQLKEIEDGKFSTEDLENAKKGIIAAIKAIEDEQDSELAYYFTQELTESRINVDEYIKKISNVSKEDVLKISEMININTIYFLKK